MSEKSLVVYVVDDDDAVRESVKWLLESVGLTVASFSSAVDFLSNYDAETAGCLVLDVRMPGMSGLDLQKELVSRNISLPIIIITGHGDVPMAVRAMKSGAVDFIEKPFNDQVLLDCIQRTLKEANRKREEQAWKREIQEVIDRLTDREKEIMEQVIQGKSSRQIGEDLNISSKTIEVHRARIMKKMGVSTVVELVRLILRFDKNSFQE
jgi:RNA polymerase sigma factor (sigma-70 family)